VFQCLTILIALLVGAQPSLAEDDTPQRIGVMLFDGVLTSDVVAPLEVFGVAIENEIIAGYEIVTIAREAGPVTTHEGLTLQADYGIADAPDLDVIIVGSRYDMDPILEDQDFMAFVTEQATQADWIASNCSGVYVLAATGLLNGVNVTTYPGGEVWLKLNQPWVKVDIGATVVVDSNVVTSNGSLVSYAAAIELLKNLVGPEQSQEVADTLYFTRLLERHGRPNG
jgi:transcriptional regulator GlxA family with amidase domain